MKAFCALIFLLALTVSASADENLFGYVRGAETLPKGAWEFYQVLTSRQDKGAGKYLALDTETELEYGVTDRFAVLGSFKTLSIDTSDLMIDGYLPKDESFSFRPSGVEAALKYNFLSAAKDDLGLATFLGFDYGWLDRHSGQKKDTLSMDLLLLLQKYYLEGEIVWVTNFGVEATYAKRAEVKDLPADFEWPTSPEMEIELKAGMGISYRFIPNWYLGAETLYESEYETEVGQERWSLFAGPNLHYANQGWWSTLTWFPQVQGGGLKYANQEIDRLHLIEKTKQEVRFKIGLNF